MVLSGNNLSGKIPSEITSLRGLRWLNLSENNLTGIIPKKIGSMSLVESLDFLANHPSGEIPPSMLSLTFLGYLNLSYNSFSGKNPSGTQLQSFSEFMYIGNPDMCGPLFIKKCTEAGNRRDKDGEEVDVDWFYLSLAPGFVVGFCSFYAIFAFKKLWRYALFGFIEDISYKLCNMCRL
ncbi:hypothetical protein GIB67_022601 [Kingdonia uniflora]|uniref:Uncharacterized protein n=1 Tax=Kingdonia uniflora TaxID=39325 RepID=A0A7J7NZM9_9MAGN|nr:hypothetical protein GIB67_022601 [Kingdonia uniflora]